MFLSRGPSNPRQILSSSPPDASVPSLCFAGQRRREFHAGWDYRARHSWSPGVQERLVEHNVCGCVCGGWERDEQQHLASIWMHFAHLFAPKSGQISSTHEFCSPSMFLASLPVFHPRYRGECDHLHAPGACSEPPPLQQRPRRHLPRSAPGLYL
jgi:hypothetical protein